MSQITRVYVLVDPRTSRIRYVGKTVKNIQARLCQHISYARNCKNNSHRDRWIRSLLGNELRPIAKEVEICGVEWPQRERFWIAYFRSKYDDLTNIADGGEGPAGAKRTAEQILANSIRGKNAARDPSVRRRLISQLMTAAKQPGARERQIEHLQSLNSDPARNKRHSEQMKIRYRDPALRQVLTDRILSYSFTAEQRERRKSSVRAAYQLEDVIQRHREATLKATSDPLFRARQRASINAAIRDPDVQKRRVESLRSSPGYQDMLRRRGESIRQAWAKRKAFA